MNRIQIRQCTMLLKDGLSGSAVSAKKTDEVQTITITSVEGGTFTVTYDSEETGNLPWDLTPAQMQSALEGLVSIGEGNMTVTGVAGVSHVCTFGGTLGEASLALMVIDDALVTGSGAEEVTIAETIDGGTGTAPLETDTTLTIETVVLNTADTDLVPVGARFTLAGETVSTTVHVVTDRDPSAEGPTTEVTFSPALGAGSYGTGAALTFAPQQIEITVGDGDLKYTEGDEYMYDLDRGLLDTVRRGDDQPMEVSVDAVFDEIKSGTGEVVTPIEALKGTGNASEWVSSSSNTCEPYAVNLVMQDVRTCATGSATYLFPDFRSEKRDFSVKDATISISGKCNVTEPEITLD